MNGLRPGADGSIWQDGVCRVKRLHIPKGFFQRGVGLMFRKNVPAAFGNGLFFPRCRALHTFWMRFPLDICFLDDAGGVVEVRRGVRPWRIVSGPRAARHVFEVAAGDLDDFTDAPVEWRTESMKK